MMDARHVVLSGCAVAVMTGILPAVPMLAHAQGHTHARAHAPVHAPAAAKEAAPCAMLTPDEIKVVLSSAVLPGKPGAASDCTWRDAKGEDRVYLSVKPVMGPEVKDLRGQMQASGHMTPVTGMAEDAFFVTSAGASAALYMVKKQHLLLLTVTGPNFSRQENEGAEKALAPKVLDRIR